jgi:hypothetical protein
MWRNENQAEKLQQQHQAEAYHLVQAGHTQEAVTHHLVELGVDSISAVAAASYRSQRNQTIREYLQKGGLALGGGLLFTAVTYSAAGPGGLFVVATGAITYGIFHLIAGLVLLSARSITREDGLRIATCTLFVILGIGLIFMAEYGGYLDGIVYWLMLIGSYLMATTGVWGLIDKSVLRLRTGNPADDAFSDEDFAKTWKFLVMVIGLIIVHLVLKYILFNSS